MDIISATLIYFSPTRTTRKVVEGAATDSGLCIRCCACIRFCPGGARTMEDPRIRLVAEQLAANCRERQEPETYL